MKIKELAGLFGLSALAAGGSVLGIATLIVIILAIVAGGTAIGSVLPYLAWNFAVAPLFHWQHITFLQTMGLVFLFGFVCRLFSR